MGMLNLLIILQKVNRHIRFYSSNLICSRLPNNLFFNLQLFICVKHHAEIVPAQLEISVVENRPSKTSTANLRIKEPSASF